jgi:4-hydroxy-tetrahydrodipicolinate reductase
MERNMKGKRMVMVNGLPGKMATLVAEEVIKQEDMTLVSASFTGPEIQQAFIDLEGHKECIALVKPEQRELIQYHPEIVVDFTQPSVALDNAKFYCSKGLEFVMGTTMSEKDMAAVKGIIRGSGSSAVVAPNMAKEVAGLQYLMQKMVEKYPGALDGYKLQVTESHQKGKVDTSGTARAMVGYVNALGIPFNIEDIVKLRDNPEEQIAFGVPEEHLGAHGWHTYTFTPKIKKTDEAVHAFGILVRYLMAPTIIDFARFDKLLDSDFIGVTSKEGDLYLQVSQEDDVVTLKHNINGRRPYVAGTMEAIRFLDKQPPFREDNLYSMADILESQGLIFKDFD